MNNEIVFVCNSVNNKNVRANELAVLRKNEDQKYFEFGENENNIKKRFYKDLETLNKDFEEILQIKKNLETAELKEIKEDSKEEKKEEFNDSVKEEIKKDFKKAYKKYNKKSLF